MVRDKINYKFKTHRVELFNNINICYTDEGKGDKTIVFIHGLANYSEIWHEQIEELKKKYRCIAVDLPGCGLSSRGDFNFSMLFYSEVIQKFCEKLKLSNVILCGHSMGGHIAIVTTLRFPALAGKLVLIAPSGFEKFNSFEISLLKNSISIGNMFFNDETHLVTLLKQSFYKMSESGSKMISDLVVMLKSENMRQWRNMVEQCVLGMLNEQVFDLLQFIECPVLAVFGENDTLIPNIYFHPVTTKRIAEKACAEIPNAQLIVIPFSGHAVFMEKPKEVNRIIAGFIS